MGAKTHHIDWARFLTMIGNQRMIAIQSTIRAKAESLLFIKSERIRLKS